MKHYCCFGCYLLLLHQTLHLRCLYHFLKNCVYVGGHIRFEAKSAGKAMEWVEAIREAIHREEERERQRVSELL